MILMYYTTVWIKEYISGYSADLWPLYSSINKTTAMATVNINFWSKTKMDWLGIMILPIVESWWDMEVVEKNTTHTEFYLLSPGIDLRRIDNAFVSRQIDVNATLLNSLNRL